MLYRLLVSGEWACFPRPEFVTDLVSYETMSPWGARGVLESIHWRPAIRWDVEKIIVLKPVELVPHPAGGLPGSGLPQVLALRDVAYLIEARFALTQAAGERDNMAAHRRMFEDRVRKNRPFRRPYLGLRECPATFRLLADDEAEGGCPESLRGERDWGWIVYDHDAERGVPTRYFRARSVDGIIKVPLAETSVLCS